MDGEDILKTPEATVIVYKKIAQIEYTINGKNTGTSNIIQILPESLAKAIDIAEKAKTINFLPKSPRRK